MTTQIKQKVEHTPTPWKTDGYIINANSLNEFGNFVILSMPHRDENIKAVKENEANAAFIVKAVNSHYELVSALKDMIDDIEKGRTEWETNGTLAYAKQALAKAGE